MERKEFAAPARTTLAEARLWPTGFHSSFGVGGGGEHRGIERLRVVVVVLVGDDQHAGVAAAPLHVLPRRAVLLAAAPVVSPAPHHRMFISTAHIQKMKILG